MNSTPPFIAAIFSWNTLKLNVNRMSEYYRERLVRHFDLSKFCLARRVGYVRQVFEQDRDCLVNLLLCIQRPNHDDRCLNRFFVHQSTQIFLHSFDHLNNWIELNCRNKMKTCWTPTSAFGKTTSLSKRSQVKRRVEICAECSNSRTPSRGSTTFKPPIPCSISWSRCSSSNAFRASSRIRRCAAETLTSGRRRLSAASDAMAEICLRSAVS